MSDVLMCAHTRELLEGCADVAALITERPSGHGSRNVHSGGKLMGVSRKGYTLTILAP